MIVLRGGLATGCYLNTSNLFTCALSFFLAILVSGWNVTVLNATYTSFALQWTKLDTRFYIIEVKSIKGNLVAVEIVPGNATSTNIHGISPSSKYRVVVYGFDGIGQPYKTLESVVATKKGLI